MTQLSTPRMHLTPRLLMGGTAQRAPEGFHLVCLSDQRWDAVSAAPRRLLASAAGSWPVLFVEEPVRERNARAHVRTQEVAPNLTVATVHLPAGLTDGEACFFQRSLLNCLVSDVSAVRRVLWYRSPLPLRFSRGMDREVCVYDRLEEAGGDRPDLETLDRELLACADMVIAGGAPVDETRPDLQRKVFRLPDIAAPDVEEQLSGAPHGSLEWESAWSAMRRHIEQVAARKRRPATGTARRELRPADVVAATGTLASAAALNGPTLGALERPATRRSP